MSSPRRGPQVLKGALISIPTQGKPQVIAFQYNPAHLRRSLQPQQVGGEQNDRSEAVRFIGAPVQTIEVEVDVDGTDQLDQGQVTTEQLGVLPQLAALELLIYPTTQRIQANQSQLAAGVMEVTPLEAPRLLFVWGAKRVLPVRLTGYSITEEIFDSELHTIRATVGLRMRVLNTTDLSASNPEYHEFMSYQENLQRLAALAPSAAGKANIGVDPGAV